MAATAHHRNLQRRAQEARRRRLGPGRFDMLVKEMAGVIRLAFEAGATATLFGLEGPLRQAIRSDLCLLGWWWDEADLMAREMLDAAFCKVNATRPAWNEGQPEWTIHAGTLIERTRCVRCHAPLPEGHFKFCSSLCASTHRKRLVEIQEADEERALDLVIRKKRHRWT